MTYEEQWMKKYELVKAFVKHYGHCNIPIKFTTSNGIDFDPNGIKIGVWLESQSRTIRDIEAGKPTPRVLNEERRKLLEEIKVPVSMKDEKWFHICDLIKKHINEYGTLPHFTFKTLDGINYDENGIILERWIRYQRTNLKKDPSSLTKEQKEALESINFVLNPRLNWDQYYDLAKQFYHHHGHLKITQNFNTFNGSTHNPHGYKLGRWIGKQREELNGWNIENSNEEHQKEISSKVAKLNNISMIWNTFDNSQKIENLFKEEGIFSFVKNFNLLKTFKNYPYIEIKEKLDFLNKNTLPVITNKHFHEIFFMSKENVKIKYGLDLNLEINKSKE